MAVLQLIFSGKDEVAGASKQVASDLRDVGGAADEAKEKGTGFFGGMLQSAAGFLAANVIGNISSQVSGFVGSAFSDAKESQQLMAQTEAVIASTGGAAGKSAQEFADLASSLSDAAGKSLFGDDQIQQAENLLATFTNLKGAVFDSATAISVDMAQALGGEPKSQAIALGKALNDPIQGVTALSRVGVTFDEQQKKQIKTMQEAGNVAGAQKIILAELNKEFGGSAEKAAAATGGWSEFKGRLGEAGETIATSLLPIIGDLGSLLLDKLMPVVESVANWFAQIGPLWSNTAGMGLSLSESIAEVVDQFLGFHDSIGPVLSIAESIDGAMEWLSKTTIPVLTAAWGHITSSIEFAITAFNRWRDGMTSFQTMLNTFVPHLGNLAATIQDKIGPPIEFAITAFNRWRDGTASLHTTLNAVFPSLAPVFDTISTAIGDLSAGVKAAFSDGGIGGAFTYLTEKLAEVSPGFALLKAVVEAALPPIQQIVTEVFGIIGGFMHDNGAKMLADVSDVWNGIQGLIRAVIPPIQSIVSSIFGAIGTFLHSHGDDIRSFMGETWSQISEIIKLAIELIKATIVPALQFVAKFITDHGAEIQRILGNTWNAIKAAIDIALTLIKGIIKIALDLIHGDWSQAWEDIKSMSARIVGDLGTIISSGLDNLKTIFSGAIQWITDEWHALPGQLADVGRAIVEAIENGLNDAWESFKASMLKKLADLRAQLPFSEPKDTSSPLYGLGKAGQAMVANIQQGIQSAPAFALPGLAIGGAGGRPATNAQALASSLGGAGGSIVSSAGAAPVSVVVSFDDRGLDWLKQFIVVTVNGQSTQADYRVRARSY